MARKIFMWINSFLVSTTKDFEDFIYGCILPVEVLDNAY